MTFAQSRKSFSCWNCEYFVHENPEESYGGYCRRKAPKAVDLYGLDPGLFDIEFYHEGALAIGLEYPQTIWSALLPANTPSGIYLIVVSYMWSMNGLTDQFYGRIVTEENSTVEMAVIENGITSSTSEFRTVAGQSIQTLPAGEQNINLQIGVQAGGSTDNAVIKKVRVSLALIQKI